MSYKVKKLNGIHTHVEFAHGGVGTLMKVQGEYVMRYVQNPRNNEGVYMVSSNKEKLLKQVSLSRVPSKETLKLPSESQLRFLR